jgi:hypothetical protein
VSSSTTADHPRQGRPQVDIAIDFIAIDVGLAVREQQSPAMSASCAFVDRSSCVWRATPGLRDLQRRALPARSTKKDPRPVLANVPGVHASKAGRKPGSVRRAVACIG